MPRIVTPLSISPETATVSSCTATPVHAGLPRLHLKENANIPVLIKARQTPPVAHINYLSVTTISCRLRCTAFRIGKAGSHCRYTMALVHNPDIFFFFLHCSDQWDYSDSLRGLWPDSLQLRTSMIDPTSMSKVFSPAIIPSVHLVTGMIHYDVRTIRCGVYA